MRIGLVGPAESDVDGFREAVELLVDRLGVEIVIYVGIDGVADALAEQWLGGLKDAPGSTFEDRAVEVALHGNADEIAALLEAEHQARRVEAIRAIPPPPARAVELLDDRIVLFVYDKSVLDEEDIANVQVIVYGHAKEMLMRKIGPRIFFTPGPLGDRRVGVVEIEEDDRVVVTAYDTSGRPLVREALAHRNVKVSVSS